MSTSSFSERERGFHSKSSRMSQASAETRSLELNALSETSDSTSSIDSRPPLAQQLTDSLRLDLHKTVLTMMKSAGEQKRQTMSSSTPTPSSMQSTKRPGAKSPVTAEPAGQSWDVKFHREVAKTIVKNGGEDAPVFTPTIRELKDDLASNLKQFPKKQGQLKEARATHVRFADGVEWVAVFSVFEETRTVRVLALGPHDQAYADAGKRI